MQGKDERGDQNERTCSVLPFSRTQRDGKLPMRFSSIAEAAASFRRCEAKECSIVRTATQVIIRTPEGHGFFGKKEWEEVTYANPSSDR